MPRVNRRHNLVMSSCWANWRNTPLGLRTGFAALLGIAVGSWLGHRFPEGGKAGGVALAVLQTTAPALIFVGLVHGLSRAEIRLRVWLRLVKLVAGHNVVAAALGLFVVNAIQPGRWIKIPTDSAESTIHTLGSWDALFHRLPTLAQHSLERQPLFLVIVAGLMLGLTLRFLRKWKRTADRRAVRGIQALTDSAAKGVRWTVGWLPETLPFVAFFCLLGQTAQQALRSILPLGYFVLTVLLGLALLTSFYLVRIRFHTSIPPRELLRAGRDALLTAFVTASSTVAMPVAYDHLQKRLGLREESASLGTLIGGNFSKDATVMYLAIAVVFTAQASDLAFGFIPQLQLLLVLGSLLPRATTPGAAGAGFPTLMLVLTAVGLPASAVPMLLAVDWWLDRCRSAVNLLGDMTVSCLLAEDFSVSTQQAKDSDENR